MTEIDWPDFLPSPSVDIAGEISSAVIRSSMESGRTRQRQRFSTIQKVQKVSWIFNPNQYQLFLYFHRHYLAMGATSFNITMPWFTTEPITIEVRFVEGKFSESWIAPDAIRITSALEQETVTPAIDQATYLLWRDSSGSPPEEM